MSSMNKATINELKFQIFCSANKLLLSRRRLRKDWSEGFEAALGVVKKEIEKAMKAPEAPNALP